MENIKKSIAYIVASTILLCVVAIFSFAAPSDFKLGRNMEVMVNMMRELSLHFVDDIDADKLMEDAAAGMVRSLDPYTQYMPEEEMSDFEFMTTGKYGGIGSLIRKKGDYIIIAQPYEDSPADLAGLKFGDKIISIEGEDAKGFTTEQVSSKLKGTPNTIVNLTIETLRDSDTVAMAITRERIAIPSIPYAGFVGDSIGYIKHSDFTDGCYDDMREQINRLQKEGNLKGLILDYRDNGGGILQEAVGVVSMFVPKGSEVVTTKGRNDSTVFRTKRNPILLDMPMVVLISNSSASAAEIVAGALQDMDRAVLIGQKSFGKGLVQSTRQLGYNSYLKLTTAKYYMPSGRCIQAIDYYNKTTDRGAKMLPDSLINIFTTKGGRKVKDGGGITPDITLEPEYISRFAITLYLMAFIDDYIDDVYMKKNRDIEVDNKTFTITDDDYKEFAIFMQDKDVPYESNTRIAMKALQKATESDLFKELSAQLEEIEKNINDDTQTNLQTYKKEIIESLNDNIILRHSYTRGVVENNIVDDPEVNRAIEIISSPVEYKEILTLQESASKAE